MILNLNQFIEKINKTRPLILNLTNYVTMDFVANGLLSIGASPVMSTAHNEIADLVSIANAVVVNLGTLNDDFIHLCHEASYAANKLNKPLILDPVGAGATKYRTETAKHLLEEFSFSIIRGNASEVAALAGFDARTKGVDSSLESESIISQAKDYSTKYKSVISISGATDFIIEFNKSLSNQSGSFLMPMVTGTGCLLSAVTAAFHAIHDNAFEAAYAASYFYGQCGERAALKANGPGSFKEAFLDELYTFKG